MPAPDPVSAALLNIYNLHADRRQAELDLERARTRETVGARSAVPGVMAQLAEQHEKQMKQRAAAQKAGEQQGPSQAAMLPPSTDVSGQPSGRGSGAGAKILGELAGTLIHRGGPQPAGQQAGMPGATLPQPGIGAGINPGAGPGGLGAASAGPSTTVAGPQAGVPGATPPQPGPPGSMSQQGQVPGSIVDVTRDLSGWEQALAIGGGILGKDLGLIAEGVRGKAVTGHRQTPTLEQIGDHYGKGLAELEALRERTANPLIRAAAENAYNQRIQEITDRYNAEAAEHAAGVGSDLRLKMIRSEEMKKEAEERSATTADELASYKAGLSREGSTYKAGLAEARTIRAEQRAASTPVGIAAAQEARVRSKLIDEGPQALKPGELASIGGLTEFYKQQKPQISPAQASALQQRIERGRTFQAAARTLQVNWFPEYFDATSVVKYEWLKGREKITSSFPAAALNAEEKTYLQQYSAMKQAMANLTIERLLAPGAGIGATWTPHEIELMSNTIPNENDDKISAPTKLDKFIENAGLDALRAEITMGLGYRPRRGYEFSDVRKMVGTFANQMVGDLTQEGTDPIEAKRQVKEMLSGRYGLDLDRYTGAQPAGQ